MRNALPGMTAEGEALKPRLPRDRDGRKKPRLPRHSGLASGPARTRRAVAPLVGGHRNPIGHWRAIDATGGQKAWWKV
jgi:hypothetical protein